MRLVVSFADIEQNHHGGIYQATNWIYDGKSNAADEYLFKGKRWHGRAFRKTHGSHLKFIDKGLEIVQGSQKHRYLFPLDQKLRDNLIKKALPYPKRLKQDQVSTPDKIGGAAPTQTLQ